MKTNNELERINCFFYNKETGELKQGDLVRTGLYRNDIYFKDGTAGVFHDFESLLNDYSIGKLPFHEKQLNKFQLIIKKIFNL